MRNNSKKLGVLIVSIVLVFSMTAVAMFSAFADDAGLVAKDEPTTVAVEDSSVAEDTTAAPEDSSVAESTTAAPAEESTKTPDVSTDPSSESSVSDDDHTVEGLVGDVDKDTKINSRDARLALRICLRLDEADDYALVAADANNDLVVKSQDARFILRYAIRIGKDDKTVIGSTIISEKGSISIEVPSESNLF